MSTPEKTNGGGAPGVDPAAPAPAVDPAAPAPGAAEEAAVNGAPELDADAARAVDAATEGPEPGAPESEEHAQLQRDLEELAAKASKADEYLELAQRTKADFENYRKRAAREAGAAQERGVLKLAKELLPAVDNLDRAVEAVESSNNGGDLLAGIRLVHAEVLAALARVGVEPF